MNNRLNVILIVFFIFFVNTAIAPSIQHDYVSLTVSPGDDLSRIASFTASSKRLFATADASGTAASWVTPKHIDFGAIAPGDKIEKGYTISVPRYQNPGYYEVVWKYNCKYTDGTACSVTSDTVLQITVKSTATQTSSKKQPIYISVTQGEDLTDYLTFTSTGTKYGLYAWADASGNAASWVTPRRIDFGSIAPGDISKKYYTISAPEYQNPGTYELNWKWGCKYTDGTVCYVTDDFLSIQITVKAKSVSTYTRPVYTPVYTPTSDQTTPFIIGLTIILILFIVWIYIVTWVARDANKRGTSGTLWGILAFFLGLLGLVLYLIARPKGNFVLCDYCGKEKLDTLTRCPHCNKTTTPAFEPAPAREKPIQYAPAIPQKPEATVDDLKKLKEKLNKINSLLEKLDERLAQGEMTEARYKELSRQYKAEAENLKNLVTEKELMQEVGLKTDEK
ncbi:MAG: hypothetical protein PHU34_00400 [Candidatus Methanoperedens sp.]|nr:hypothetical protein [Candidatus Methanoperedens sp.]